ncbi:MAG TPA: hypothetical protein VM888_14700, partial [Chitinophagaceae bacterium]|nr:hypothetical protein [Chitinophagaceae bacterium]
MQKVYLLLRDNQQSGPYTLAEIIEGGLKPYDLVWVEGKSAGWSYPGEVEALKPYAPKNPLEEKTQLESLVQPSQVAKEINSMPKKIFVSLTAGKVMVNENIPAKDPIEKKAEELRQRLQAYTPQTE